MSEPNGWTGRGPAIVEAWLERVIEAYPAPVRQSLRSASDPFRNPFAACLARALPVLFAEIVGGMDGARLRSALDEVVRVQAVQEIPPSQAAAFPLLLRQPLRDASHGASLEPPRDVVEDRIDQVTRLAFDQFEACREQVRAIAAREAGRLRVPTREG